MRRVERPLVLASGGTGGGTSAPVDVSDLEAIGIQIEGTFSASVDIRINLSGSSQFETYATVSGTYILALPLAAAQVDVVVNGYVSGTVVATAVGYQF